jgi:dihydrofolate reductase
VRQIILYIATSPDGFIARESGSVDWFESFPNPDNQDYGYHKFYNSIDTILMGRRSYDQILGFDIDFPFSDKKNFVFTHTKSKTGDANVKYISDDINNFIAALKNEPGKDIWLLGGAAINTALLEQHLIDRIILTQTPVLLGNGIPLFNTFRHDHKLELQSVVHFNTGFIQTQYTIQ